MSRWIHALTCVLLVFGCSGSKTIQVATNDFKAIESKPRDGFLHIVLKDGHVYDTNHVEFDETSLVIVNTLSKTHTTVTFPLEISYEDIEKIEIRENDYVTPKVVVLVVRPLSRLHLCTSGPRFQRLRPDISGAPGSSMVCFEKLILVLYER